MALETPSRPTPPLHGKCHLKFPFWLFDSFPYVAIIIGCEQESVYQTANRLNGKWTGKEMLMLGSSPGVQSSIARRTALFSTLAVLLVGIWEILLPLELKMSGFARWRQSHHVANYYFSFIGWFQSNKRQFWRLQRALGYFQSRGVSIHLAIL